MTCSTCSWQHFACHECTLLQLVQEVLLDADAEAATGAANLRTALDQSGHNSRQGGNSLHQPQPASQDKQQDLEAQN